MRVSPLVSVIMGTFNPIKENLHRAVKSIICQSVTDWEFLIYDDGSAADCKKMIKEIASIDSRIKVIYSEKNQGLAHALNECIKFSTGTYIARMDDDDYSVPDRFKKQIDFLKCNKEYSWVGSNAYLFDGNGIWGVGNRKEKPERNDFFKYSPFIHPSVMFRGEIIRSIGGYCDSKKNAKCEDYELFLRLYALGYKGYNLMENLLFYQENSNAIKKRPFVDAWNEMNIRRIGFRKLGLSKLKETIYVIKPIAVYISSVCPRIAQSLRKKRKTGDSSNNKATLCELFNDKKSLKYYKFLSKSPYLFQPFFNALLSPENDLYKANLTVLAPTINGYVIWLLSEAKKKNIRRLYFLARDGYIPYLVTKKYCERYKIEIECKYIFCSRYSLRLPLYHFDINETINQVCRGGIDVTLRKVLLRSGISDESEQMKISEKLDVAFPLDEIILYSDLRKIRKSLLNCPYYISTVEAISLQAWRPLKGYLEQEGLFEEINMAIVDSGWTGTIQASLHGFLEKCNYRGDLQGFYFGLYETPNGREKKYYNSFYFSQNKNLINKVLFSNCLFETVFSAPHTTTIGYKLNGCKYVPVLSDGIEINSDFHRTIEADVMKYTNELLVCAELCCFDEVDLSKIKKALKGLLSNFMWSPTRDESENYGKLFFSDDLLDNNIQPIGASMTPGQLRSNHFGIRLLTMLGIIKGKIKESAWYEAAAVNSCKISLYHRISYGLYKAFVYIKNAFMKRSRVR